MVDGVLQVQVMDMHVHFGTGPGPNSIPLLPARQITTNMQIWVELAYTCVQSTSSTYFIMQLRMFKGSIQLQFQLLTCSQGQLVYVREGSLRGHPTIKNYLFPKKESMHRSPNKDRELWYRLQEKNGLPNLVNQLAFHHEPPAMSVLDKLHHSRRLISLQYSRTPLITSFQPSQLLQSQIQGFWNPCNTTVKSEM